MSGKTRVLGGITVIDTPLITRAMDYARVHSEPYLFNHAVRSWLFAARLGQLQGVPHDAEVVAVGSLLHDLGLTNSFTGEPLGSATAAHNSINAKFDKFLLVEAAPAGATA
jgi:HD superfamily phosphodiesterase